ncbi:MAG: thioesterase family protein [Nitriliruptoraceae bacterium]|nr:thioesterase family protein [Nitriliruptoraceae bacterium]
MDRPLFERDGDRVVATSLARGPWDERSCHGGAPAALLAAAVDAVETLCPMQVVRLTYDLLRPVPVGHAMRLATEVVREGKRVQTVEATLTDDASDAQVMRVRALRLRTATLELPEDRPAPDPAPSPGPDQLNRLTEHPKWRHEGFWNAVDIRFATGGLGEPGRGLAWFELLAPLADGFDVVPVARAAAAADFGNGIGAPLAMGPYQYVNPDLTVDLHRLPRGRWVALEATSVAETTGIGLTTSAISDEHGRIGTALQSLFVAPGSSTT